MPSLTDCGQGVVFRPDVAVPVPQVAIHTAASDGNGLGRQWRACEGLCTGRPSHTADGPNLQWAPLIEADHGRSSRPATVQLSDQFFLLSNRGSCERFQVRMRCALKPSRRSSRRTHSSVTGGNKVLARQYSASLGTDQLENGSPRSSGLDSATSTNSRNCSDFRIGGRPFGLATCSKVANPESLNRCTQS